MFAISTIIVSPSGDYRIYEGSFTKTPAELSNITIYNKIIKTKEIGWHEMDFGYLYYVIKDVELNKYIFHGLNVPGKSKVKKKYSGYIHEFTTTEVESYAKSIINFISDTRKDAEKDLNVLVHDLRNISSSIYNSAVEAENLLNLHNYTDVQDRIHSIIASQNMLKIRTDVLDYVGNPTSIVENKEIAIYKKVDKVKRIFQSKARANNITITMSGHSFNITFGPNIFEIVPYIFIDNAIKYSPTGGSINVTVQDSPAETLIIFFSYGPRINEDELATIFDRGYRGVHALDSARPGSGLGLSLARNLVENHFKGTITVEQNSNGENDSFGSLIFGTTFTIKIPSKSINKFLVINDKY